MQYKRIKIGKKYIEAMAMSLLAKKLIVLRGSRGYVMCGYLNLAAANKFKEVAVKIVGVASLEDALKTKVFALSHAAKQLGIYKGQPIQEVLKIIV